MLKSKLRLIDPRDNSKWIEVLFALHNYILENDPPDIDKEFEDNIINDQNDDFDNDLEPRRPRGNERVITTADMIMNHPDYEHFFPRVMQ